MAFVAPLGSRLTTISASFSFSVLMMLFSVPLLVCMMFFVYSPTPSKVGPLWTMTFDGAVSISFGVLFGSANMASDRSFPTFRSSMSNAATVWMSFG